MGKVLSSEINRFLSLKRFWILTVLTFLAGLLMVVDTKTTFFNDFMFLDSIYGFNSFIFNMAVGIIIFVSLYRRKYTRKSIELSEENNVKRGVVVISEWMTGTIAIIGLYIAIIPWVLLLGLIFGAHSTGLQIKAMSFLFLFDMIASIGCFSAALIFFYLTAFPVLPIVIYGALIWVYPIVTSLFKLRGIWADIYFCTKSAYTSFMFGNVNLWFIPVLMIYVAFSLGLSVLIFSFKKKERKKRVK